jgi:two-component system, chemotaxis family, sensor kinase CheA
LLGFSTARQVTGVSGRGVGMDVVKTNVDKIGGTVELESRAGAGTTIRIKIPLTLAIVPALVVGVRGHRLAIPQVSLLELVRVERGGGGAGPRAGIEWIHGAPVYRLRGDLLPLVRLDEVLGLAAAAEPARETQVVNIVVLQADDRPFGLIVDEVRDTEEIVVKPLGKELKHISVFSGATIMGDGRVALILDVLGLAHRAGAVSGARERAAAAAAVAAAAARAAAAAAATQTLLLFRAGDSAMAIPLAMVARIEELPAHQVERSGGRAVVPCRGEILPLVEVPVALGARAAGAPARPTLEVMVYSEAGRSVGLVVDQVLAVVDHDVRLTVEAPRSGILGTTLVDGVVTHLLDVPGLIQDHCPGLLGARGST